MPLETVTRLNRPAVHLHVASPRGPACRSRTIDTSRDAAPATALLSQLEYKLNRHGHSHQPQGKDCHQRQLLPPRHLQLRQEERRQHRQPQVGGQAQDRDGQVDGGVGIAAGVVIPNGPDRVEAQPQRGERTADQEQSKAEAKRLGKGKHGGGNNGPAQERLGRAGDDAEVEERDAELNEVCAPEVAARECELRRALTRLTGSLTR